ncbi:type I restriction endonuclease subunit R [Deinococcus soli (ex Cha et al. 2016)]|uniref:type I restriction endonuclease subunit R n=1 Tax=Deinococcus soli (ex Cha et al. 2016) TaxID=1309411 RepID=UPI00166B7CC7|nr:HsdR family type I site-specific deoxyribonuclease [Deinococcus soli (ex Cha et al. 2016)]
MTSGPEYIEVEFPFVEQLILMGWEHLVGDRFDPALTERTSFRETLLEGRLRAAVRSINGPLYPWMEESHVSEVVTQFTRLPAGVSGLLAVNAHLTGLLLDGVPVMGPDGRAHTFRCVEFRNVDANDFLAINQFRVDPPGYSGGPGFIVPDVVLFVNGLPLVVVECKAPDVAVEKAVNDLLLYQNCRGSAEPEGVERFFHTAQLLVGTSFYRAVLGTVGAPLESYLSWKDTYPFGREEVQAMLGKPQLHPQQVLVAGVLRRDTLLSLLENFTLTDAKGKRVARYQQFRAVGRALSRLQAGETRLLGAEVDGRGGIVWHTQGSGKSLTMMFLVRAIRTVPELRAFKIVVVTDRRDLEKQLVSTAKVAGEPITRARTVQQFRDALRVPGAGFVFGMIQKMGGQPNLLDLGEAVLNASPDVLVLVDEAHRSHGKDQHAQLRAALPNAALIGFTGTPIITGEQKKTHEIFGPAIDTYTILQSQEDGATVPILYEGRTLKAFLKDGQSLDGLFDVFFDDLSEEARRKLREKYGTLGDMLSSPKLIAMKAEDMLLHYASQVLPNRFKAQVVASSREAAVEYHRAFLKAQAALLEELSGLSDMYLTLPPEKLAKLPERTRALVLAHPHRERLAELTFAPVISAGPNDPADWAEWTDHARQETRIGEDGQFKDPKHPLSILIVKSMLLTGFDAPVEQALYLDRNIRNHELLQAIARVNRTAPGKTHGLVVDYFGVGHHLAKALSEYTQTDIQGAMTSIKDTLPVLEAAHHDVMRLFTEAGLTPAEREDCVNLLVDAKLRAEFRVRLKAFLRALDTVLPRPEALRFVQDAALLGRVSDTARLVYQDGDDTDTLGGGAKVRALIAQYVDASGIQVKVPRIEVLDPNFRTEVGGFKSSRTKAAAMEHAARHFINARLDEDPVYYRKLSEKLEDLLKQHEQHWDALAEALMAFIEQMQAGRPADSTGLDPRSEAPFFSLLLEAQDVPVADLPAAQRDALITGTLRVVHELRRHSVIPDFWRNTVRQDQLRGWLVTFLDDEGLVAFEACETTADELMSLAKRLHQRWLPQN